MIKMIVSDLDGTLLHADFTYTKRTIRAIKTAISQGICFLPASGRSFLDVKHIFHKEGIACGAICINGAQVYNENGCVLYENEIDKHVLKKIIDVLKKLDLSIQIFSDKGFYAYENAYRVARDMECVISRNMNKHVSLEEANTLYAEELSVYKILKIETMNLDEIRLDECKKSLGSIANIEVTSSVKGNLEITHIQSTKGYMLEKIIKDCNIDKEEVLIFGDSENDISLFTKFPNTVAVANAKACIKERARYQCDACEEDGVAKYIEELVCT